MGRTDHQVPSGLTQQEQETTENWSKNLTQPRKPARCVVQKVAPRSRRQLIQATPAPARMAAPTAVQAPSRALVAMAWWPLEAAMAQVIAQMISMSTAMTRTKVSFAPIALVRSLMSPTASKSGKTAMAGQLPEAMERWTWSYLPPVMAVGS